MVAAVGALMCVCLLVLWFGIRIEATRERRRNCAHKWGKPTVFAGYWSRHCQLCGTQEPCPPPSGDADSG